MYKVVLADDETIIRKGLHHIIDWDSLGFVISGEASDGKEAVSVIMDNNPDVVLLDIKMPKMSGLEVAKTVRSLGFWGKIIILSGYSDFKFAQEAIRYGVAYYLTKPIDAKELKRDIEEVVSELDRNREKSDSINKYQEKVRKNILTELLTGSSEISQSDISVLSFEGDSYRVVLYEKFSRSFADITYNLPSLLRITNSSNNDFETITIDNYEVVILKSSFAISQFNRFVDRMNSENMPQKGSPLDSLFLTCGRIVSKVSELSLSYKEALLLMERRFFCRKEQHTIDYLNLPNSLLMRDSLTSERIDYFANGINSSIQVNAPSSIDKYLEELEKELYLSLGSIQNIKVFLTDLFIRIKEQLNFTYHPTELNLPGNSQIIEYIQSRYYLYQILDFYRENFALVLDTVNVSSCDKIIENVAAYINRNYMENLKLESISKLFGYNSSYLGKTFTQQMGINFNTYLDNVRIENAKKMLEENESKIYQIAAKVGFKNVDSFHKKFKRVTNMTPADYKRKFSGSREDEE